VIGFNPSDRPEWTRLYESVLLDADNPLLSQHIEEAKVAIARRLPELTTEEDRERSELLSALRVLKDLARIKGCDQQDAA
jgi:hypothetical protein